MAVAPEVRQAPPLVIARQPTPRPWRRVRVPKSLWARLGLIVACGLFLVPFYWMANSALKNINELSSVPPTFYPHAPAFENFVRAVTYIPFGTFLLNSVILTAGVTIGSAISNPLIAYGFSRIKWPGRGLGFCSGGGVAICRLAGWSVGRL